MTQIAITVRDETTSGDVLHSLDLQLTKEQTTLRELIQARVHQEVRAHNAAAAGRADFRGLITPTEQEVQLNGHRDRRMVDAAQQTIVALNAFEQGRVLVLVDDLQRTELDEQITLHPGSDVVFLRLVPLVGG